MSVTKRDAIAHMISQLEITEQCIAGAEDPKARAILQNSAECFRMAIADMQGTLPSNADRIRAMSDTELAETLVVWLYDWCEYECPDGKRFLKQDKAIAHTLQWLRQPAKEE